MRNADIADAFDELADRLALTDLKPYRYLAYRQAATRFRELAESVEVLSSEGRLRDVPGVGAAIDDKVRALLATGTFPALERAREEVPDTLLQLTRVPGIGAATARRIHEATDGESLESLLERARAGTLASDAAVGGKAAACLAQEAERRAAGGGDAALHEGVPRDEQGLPLAGPWIRRDQALALVDAIVAAAPESLRDAAPSGAYARGCELVCEVAVVAVADDPQAALGALADQLGGRGWEVDEQEAARPRELQPVAASGVATVRAVGPSGVPALIAVAAPEHEELVRHCMAGPAAWVEREPAPAASGSAVPIELRERVLRGDLDPRDLPTPLLTAADLRGELHTHSDWSDGRATILEMARAARDQGDEFLAVTDHSAPYAMVGGLDEARLLAQAQEIAAANDTLRREHEVEGASPLRILHGTECEILADGALGLSDAVLRRLDWVVASIHVAQRQSASELLARMRRVADNPLVDAIAHPTSRRVLVRSRTALDIDALIELAAQTGLVLEINSNPDRLDLDSEHAALALRAGIRLTVNTDAHQPRTLAYRAHGVAVARRAGARVQDVVNCLTAAELLASRRRERS